MNVSKIRIVKGYFQAPPFDWATDENPFLREKKWTFVVLECGHIKRDPWEVYGNEKAVLIRAATHHLLTPQASRRVRCCECVSGRQQSCVPKSLPDFYFIAEEFSKLLRGTKNVT